MNRMWTAVDVEELARAEPPRELLLHPGDLISPYARDIAQGHGVTIREAGTADAQPSVTVRSEDVASPTDSTELAHSVSAELVQAVRGIVASVVAANPEADAEAVAKKVLQALGAGGPGIGSPQQAEPLPGHSFPKKAKGARPQYFDEPGIEAIISTLLTTTSELWVLRERVLTLEQVLADRGVIEPGAVEKHKPSQEVLTARSNEAEAFVGRVLRVFHEWREEIVADESSEGYGEIVRRAFSEVNGEVNE